MRSFDYVTGEIVDSALLIHQKLGPGLLESVYETLLTRDLERRGFSVERQVTVAFDYDGIHFEKGLRIDLPVNGIVVVEVKSVEKMAAVHWRQVLTYVRLANLPVGLLVNFGGATLKEGRHRILNDRFKRDLGVSG